MLEYVMFTNEINPKRIKEACEYKKITLEEASKLCKIKRSKFIKYANGEEKIPKEVIFNLMVGFGFPRKFFSAVKYTEVPLVDFMRTKEDT
jgi:transcriptional regulator with XRE-family HTH domain